MGKKILVVISILGLVLVLGCAKKKVVSPSMQSENTQVSESQEGTEIKGLKELQEQRAKELREKELKEKQQQEAKAQVNIQEVIAERIFFDFDSYELKPEARSVLQKKAEVLKANPNLKIVIEGHCDERGTEEYNLALGEKRARAAYEFLILLGVDANRMQIVSYGEEYPLDPGHNETAWAKNRRDEFKIIAK